MNNCSTSIEIMARSNYNKWKQDLDFTLGVVDLDLAQQEN